MIWLGYPEEETAGAPEGLDDAKKAIEEVTAANERIDDLEIELAGNLEKLDERLKKDEKEEWIGRLNLANANSDMSWGEIEGEFRAAYTMEELPASGVPEAFCNLCMHWMLPDRTECPEHGPGQHVVMDHEINSFDALLSKMEDGGGAWEHMASMVPFGKYGFETIEMIEAVIEDGGCSSVLSDFETEVGKVIEGMEKLRSALEEMRKAGESSGGGSSDIKDFVKGIKSIKIDTVENIVMDGKRWIVEHRVPGRSGVDSGVSASIIQDMGRMPTRISFHGVLTGDNVPGEQRTVTGANLREQEVLRKLELLKWFYKKRAPLFFACSFLNRAELATKVMIEDLHLREEQVVNDQVNFRCTLVEYSDVHWEPPESHDEQLQGMREGVEIWAQYRTLDLFTSYRNKYTADPKTKAVYGMINGGRLK